MQTSNLNFTFLDQSYIVVFLPQFLRTGFLCALVLTSGNHRSNLDLLCFYICNSSTLKLWDLPPTPLSGISQKTLL